MSCLSRTCVFLSNSSLLSPCNTTSRRPSWLWALPLPEEHEGPDILGMLGSCSLHPAVFLLDLLTSPTSVSEFKEMTFSPWHQRTEEGKEGKCVRGCFRHWKRKGNAPANFVLHSLGRKEHSCAGCRTREQARIKVIMDYVSLTPKFIGITPMVQHSEMGLWKATGLRFSINSRRKAHCRLSILKTGDLVSATT